MTQNFRDASRADWVPVGDEPTHEQIQVGALQRIADATEKMAADYDALRRDRDFWKRRVEELRMTVKRLQASNIAFKGTVTRLRNKLEESKSRPTEQSRALDTVMAPSSYLAPIITDEPCESTNTPSI